MRFLIVASIALSFGCTENLKRKIKDVKSNYLGLNRKVSIYNEGLKKPIKEYRGEIDIDYKPERILFEVNGKRVTVTGGLVIVEEE